MGARLKTFDAAMAPKNHKREGSASKADVHYQRALEELGKKTVLLESPAEFEAARRYLEHYRDSHPAWFLGESATYLATLATLWRRDFMN